MVYSAHTATAMPDNILANAANIATPASTVIHTDALVIGAGPAGLYAAFQLGLLGLGAHIIDAQAAIGGQCLALYGDKPIYDIPGITSITGQGLAQGLLAQLAQIQAYAPLAERLHLGQLVASIQPENTQANAERPRYRVRSSAGLEFSCSSIVLAAGVGAFVPRSLKIPGLENLAPSCLHYQPSLTADFAGQSVVIVGEEDEAIHWACDLAASGLPASVVLNHRRAQLAASPAAQARLQTAIAAGQLRFLPGIVQGLEQDHGQLQALQLLQADGSTACLPCTRLGMILGLAPQMGPLADWGVALQRRQVAVDSANFATNLPGVFAIGDVISYPGKLKLIACAFHEATLAAHAALAYCAPERVGPLQYTSSSALLQGRLGL